MIKNFKYMLAAATLLVAAASCQDDPEDAFSKNPTAPVMAENGSILMTQNTMSESGTWAWTAARFTSGSVSYQLKGIYGDKTLNIGSATNQLTTTLSKVDFKSVADQFGAPSNSSFTLKMYVTATDNNGSYDSDPITVTVFSYGDAVSAVVTTVFEGIDLDMDTPNEEIDLLTWEPARIGYNEDITYSVVVSYNGGEPVYLASGLTGTSYSTTMDALNEAIVAAGGPEQAEDAVDFQVIASSASIAELPSEKATMLVTTYKASYPDQLYLPGSYQNWDPATAPTIPQSTLTKGLFEAFVDLSTEDGSDVKFKFSPNPAWGEDFGSDDLVVTQGGQNNTTIATGTTVGTGDLVVPSGMYRISCDMKHKTVELEKVVSVGIIGDAVSTGWSSEIKMTYDANARTYSVKTTLTQGKSYKFRINDDWDFSIGDNGAFSGGANYSFEQETGEYNVILNVASHPYTVKVLSTKFPVQLYLPGSYQGWNPATAPTLQGNGEGVYEGGVQLGTEGETKFKFSPNPEWKDDFGCDNLTLADGVYTGTYGASDNLVVPAGYYYITVDMTASTVKLEPISSLGIIGGFDGNSWGSDVTKLTYDETANVWTATYNFTAGTEWKIRANDAWSWNRGCGALSLGTQTVVANGDNMKVSDDGTYTVVLDLSVNPNVLTLKK